MTNMTTRKKEDGRAQKTMRAMLSDSGGVGEPTATATSEMTAADAVATKWATTTAFAVC